MLNDQQRVQLALQILELSTRRPWMEFDANQQAIFQSAINTLRGPLSALTQPVMVAKGNG